MTRAAIRPDQLRKRERYYANLEASRAESRARNARQRQEARDAKSAEYARRAEISRLLRWPRPEQLEVTP